MAPIRRLHDPRDACFKLCQIRGAQWAVSIIGMLPFINNAAAIDLRCKTDTLMNIRFMEQGRSICLFSARRDKMQPCLVLAIDCPAWELGAWVDVYEF